METRMTKIKTQIIKPSRYHFGDKATGLAPIPAGGLILYWGVR